MDCELVCILLSLQPLPPLIMPLHYSSKDAVIRVWDRETLGLHRTLRGHEGPVNAIGLQSGRVVRNWLGSKIRETEGCHFFFYG